MLAGLVIFLSVSAGILIGSYGVSPETYGLLFAVVSCFHLAGTFIGARLVTGIGIVKMIGWGVAIGLVGSFLTLILATIGLSDPFALIIPMGIFMFGLGFVNPNTIAGALQPFPEIAGFASSITNFIRGILGATISFGITFFKNDDALILAVAIFVLNCAAFIIYRFGIKTQTTSFVGENGV